MAKKCKWTELVRGGRSCVRPDGWRCSIKRTTDTHWPSMREVKGWRGVLRKTSKPIRERFFKNKTDAEKWCRNTRIGSHG